MEMLNFIKGKFWDASCDYSHSQACQTSDTIGNSGLRENPATNPGPEEEDNYA